MNIFVDTSVWSLALRRDAPGGQYVAELARAVRDGDTIFTAGLVVQEILQGVSGPRQREHILARLASLPVLHPEWHDHVSAAELFNNCRRAGVQIESIDALFAQLCIGHGLTLLTADADFHQIARHAPLEIWRA